MTKLDKEEKLILKLSELVKKSGWDIDLLDASITINLSPESTIDDLLVFIDSCEKRDKTEFYILGEVFHDLNGLKDIILNNPGCEGFCPRTKGFAERMNKDSKG